MINLSKRQDNTTAEQLKCKDNTNYLKKTLKSKCQHNISVINQLYSKAEENADKH